MVPFFRWNYFSRAGVQFFFYSILRCLPSMMHCRSFQYPRLRKERPAYLHSADPGFGAVVSVRVAVPVWVTASVWVAVPVWIVAPVRAAASAGAPSLPQPPRNNKNAAAKSINCAIFTLSHILCSVLFPILFPSFPDTYLFVFSIPFGGCALPLRLSDGLSIRKNLPDFNRTEATLMIASVKLRECLKSLRIHKNNFRKS